MAMRPIRKSICRPGPYDLQAQAEYRRSGAQYATVMSVRSLERRIEELEKKFMDAMDEFKNLNTGLYK